ncbi:hypothetical protein B0T24DRAFT_123940 [Lasiosphaeria ovina]|uniref:HNH nuclease domain-containing protein n=1 Tax=Lasiosphaeria ovina TaxID=92902 RepID=A0AAE0MXM7_9PEZI|nr:hypothetical protein B0T24DRAFT_123940 [Lasiosphaeria ovina]
MAERARDKYEKARSVSHELQKAFDDLSRKVEPEINPGEERQEPDAKSGLELASLGVELALKKKEEIRLERQVIIQERDENLTPPKIAVKRLQDTDRRYLSAGDELWKQQLKKIRFDDPGVVRLLDPRSCLLELYKKCDGVEKTKKRPASFRSDTLTYYAGNNEKSGLVWCHIAGRWLTPEYVKAAHIVPFFLDSDEIGEILFGSRAPSLRRAGNALLLSNTIEKWFDIYHLLIVPVDSTETPITRWKVDIISPNIRNSYYLIGLGDDLGKNLDGRELQFQNNNRPVSRFMYFKFIMALVRIKDIKRQGWQDIWARYYQQRPFPTPGNYLRRSMLLALATHFGTVDMEVGASWITDYGFDSPLMLTDEESTEAARRVHAAAECAMARADRKPELDDGDEDGNENSDSDGDSEEDEDEDDSYRTLRG